MTRKPDRQTGSRGGAEQTARWLAVATALVMVLLMLGLGAAVMLETTGTPDGWATRANVGDSFGVMNAIVSALALAALIVTLWLQSRELALQRAELAMQRESLNQSRVELHRTAEASLRMLHVDLIRMAIDDPSLAAVWPPLEPGAPHGKERQYLYANLIYQHMWLGLRIGDYTDEQVHNRLRYLFTSPVMREYWRAASRARTSLVPDSAEFQFAQAADRACRQWTESPRSEDRWERLDSDATSMSGP